MLAVLIIAWLYSHLRARLLRPVRKGFGITFLAAPDRSMRRMPTRHVFYDSRCGILAASCIVLGVFSYRYFRIARYSYMLPNLLTISALLIASYILAFAAMRSLASQKTRTGETWGCGILSRIQKWSILLQVFRSPSWRYSNGSSRQTDQQEKLFSIRARAYSRKGMLRYPLLKFFEGGNFISLFPITL